MNAWPTATAALLSAVEAAIEGALKYDPGSRAALARLGEHTLALHVSAPTANIYLHLTESGVRFSQHHEGDIATSLSGRAGDLARLVFTPVSNLHNTGVTVAGDTSLLAGLQAIVQNLEIDWSFLAVFTSLSIVGIFVGIWLNQFIDGKKLKKGFGWFVLVMGIYIIIKELG